MTNLKSSCAVLRSAFGAVVFAAELLPSFESQAGDFYLNVDEKTQDFGAFTNKSYWVDSSGNPMSDWEADGVCYVMSLTAPGASTHEHRYLRTPTVQGEVAFPGGQLVLQGNYNTGKLGILFLQKSDAIAKFDSGVLLKANSRIVTDDSGCVLKADVTTATEDVGTVPHVQPNTSKNSIRFDGKLLSGTTTKKNASIQFDPFSESRGEFTVEFADGGLSEYPGQLELVAFPLKTGFAQSLKVVVGTDTCSGKIYPHRKDGDVGKVVPITFAVRECGDVFKIATFGVSHNYTVGGVSSTYDFTLASGMAFEFSVDGASGQCGQFMVTQNLRTGYQNASNVVIRLVGDPVNATVTNKFATLSVPKATPLDAANFILECRMAYPWKKPFLSVEENGDYSTVFVTVPPVGEAGDVVTMVQSDSSTHSGNLGQTSAFESGSAWSDGNAPQSDRVYLMAGTNSSAVLVARTPCPTWDSRMAPYVFPEGSSLRLWQRARIQTQKASLRFDDLRSYEGLLGKNAKFGTVATTGIYKINDAVDTTTIGGNITIESGYFSFGCFHDQSFVIDARLHGTGTLAFSGMFVIDRGCGNYVLNGVNDDFHGKMRACISYNNNEFRPSYTATSKLWISDARSLGASLDTMTADALQLADYARLVATNSFTIAAESNRGISIEDNAAIDIGRGDVVRVETPLSISGNLYKDGDGVLALAGATTATTDSARLIVTNGTLQLAGAGAVAGLEVRFAAGSRLAVEPGIGTKGVDLTTTSIALDASFSGVLPLVRASGAFAYDATSAGLDVPLFTVKTADKSAFQAMLPRTPPKLYAGTSSTWNEPVDDVETATTTFSVHVERSGMVLIAH